MNLTHNGKIGRLPRAIQEQLNHHIQNGEKGRGLVAWLNSQPEAQAVMAREMAAEIGELQPADAPPLTDQMAGWVTVRYLLAVRKLAEKNKGGEPDLKVLRDFLRDVVSVRRGDHSAARLKIEQERLDRLQRMRQGETIPPPLTMEVSERM
jgi:uncharacterized membrane protein YccC